MDETFYKQIMFYSKENIKRIIHEYTSKNVYVFMSSPAQDLGVYELINNVIECVQNSQTDALYLVIELNDENLANVAYLAHFSYTKEAPMLTIIPFIDCYTVRLLYIYTVYNCPGVVIDFRMSKISFDVTDGEKPLPYILEYVKCRMKFDPLDGRNQMEYIDEIKAINAKDCQELEMMHLKILKEIVHKCPLEELVECNLCI